MAYTKQTWADLPSKTTPINANRLTHIEDGIFNAAATADNAASTAGTAAANVGIVSGKVETLTERVNGLDTAVSNKVDKVAGKGLSTNDYDNTDKGKVDSLGTASTKNSTSVVTESSDLVESGAVYDAIESAYQLVEDSVGWTGKNQYESNATTALDQAGVNWVVNADKSISVSGTPTGFLAFYTYGKALPTGKYKLFGISDTVNVAFNNIQFIKNGTANRTIPGTDLYEGCTFEVLSTDDYNKLYVTLKRSVNNTACSGTVRLMIIKEDMIDTSYEVYHPTVEESKCDNSVIAPVENGSTASQAYAVGSHAIRNGAFITWKNAKAQGETINDASDYTSGDVANELTNKVTEVTTNNNNITFHATYRKVVRYGNVVQFKVRITLASPLAGGSDVTLFNIGYVPVFNYIRAYVYEANAKETDLGNICSIASDGRITTKYALQASAYNVEGVVIVQ